MGLENTALLSFYLLLHKKNYTKRKSLI